MFTKSNFSLKGLVIIAGGLLFTGVAFAGSSNNSPGSACIATSGANLTVLVDGEAENQSASTVTAICPAERPSGVGTTATTTLSGKVIVVDQSPTGNVCCRAVSKNPSGTKITGAWECSTGNDPGYQPLELSSISDAKTFSSFYIECHVPATNNGNASRIQMYRAIQQ